MMCWVKLNSAVEMRDAPALGTADGKKPIMALAIDKSSRKGFFIGIARAVVKRKGDVAVSGFIDKSKLVIVESKDGLKWDVKEELKIKEIKNVMEKLVEPEDYFIGLEDPDIFVEGGVTHVYFSISFKLKHMGYVVYLGHAEGKNLYSLKATKPVLSPDLDKIDECSGFKEVAISPIVFKGSRINLCESGYWDFENDCHVSTIVSTEVKNLNRAWNFSKVVGDPRKMKYLWCQGHLSPAFILPPAFLEKDNLLLAIINGRTRTKSLMGKKIYGRFAVGLALFNPKTGELPWISPTPLIDDKEARTITFASDYLPINSKEIILYAHIDDSFVRAYKINLQKLKKTPSQKSVTLPNPKFNIKL